MRQVRKPASAKLHQQNKVKPGCCSPSKLLILRKPLTKMTIFMLGSLWAKADRQSKIISSYTVLFTIFLIYILGIQTGKALSY